MHIDISSTEKDLRRIGDLAKKAEELGQDAVWCGEAGCDPFLQANEAIRSTERVSVGTGIAVALARTPMTVAYSAWSLADASRGRFILGLGSQIKPHIERRYSMPWTHPVEQMREFVLATRTIFEAWRTEERLSFQGKHYTHTLMSPFFAPTPHDYDIPIHLAAVGPRMFEMAGEVADGVLLHSFTNRAYLDTVSFPALDKGLAEASRTAQPEVSLPMFMVMGDTDEELETQRQLTADQLSFYASTPAYQPVLEAIGFGDAQPELTVMSKRGEWKAMATLVSDELLDHFAITGKPEDMPRLARNHVGPRVNRVTSYFGWPDLEPGRLEAIFADFNAGE